ARCATVMHPRPLTRSGAVRLIHRLTPSTPVRVCCELHSATHGYPWLLAELARQLRSARPGVTEAGRRTVRRRMAELDQRARALAGGGATAEVVARHLLRTAPHADPSATATLRRAAQDATERGAPDDAVAYLERALAERAAGDDRSQMLVQLATASFDAGRL